MRPDRRTTIYADENNTVFKLIVADLKESDAGLYGIRLVNKKAELMSTCKVGVERKRGGETKNNKTLNKTDQRVLSK